jgi:6-phosphofructo-2-kinase/fructose-2,6-biphosphatase 4
MAAQLYQTQSGRLFHAGVISIVTVGLPARGKTHITRALTRYLNWLGVKTRTFHLGDYRRQLVGPKSAEFFNPLNTETHEIRGQIAETAINAMIDWFGEGGQVGIYDASNTSRQRRAELFNQLDSLGIHVMFIESICDNQDIVESNIRSVKVSSPDYLDWDPEKAAADFRLRINNHKPFYETLDDNDKHLSYVKIINLQQMIMNNIRGYLETRIVYYLMNLHITSRTIYFVRDAECEDEHILSSSSHLSEAGHNYSHYVKEMIMRELENNINNGDRNKCLKIWTSTLNRSVETGYHFIEHEDECKSETSSVNGGTPTTLPASLTTTTMTTKSHSKHYVNTNIYLEPRKALVPIHYGEAEGLSLQELAIKYPEEVVKHKKDPYRHRYPRAESYLELAIRLEPTILELEREKDDVVIIAHESVLRCIYAYFFDIPEREIPFLKFPRNYIVAAVPTSYGSKEVKIPLPKFV